MNILAFGAHPDDIEIQCAGTLHKYKTQGHNVFMACASNGDMGHMHIPPAELAKIREAEMRKAAGILGAEVIWLDIAGATIYEDDATRKRFIDVIRKTKPDVVITHHPDDYHDNHRSTSRLVREAIFQASVPHIKTDFGPIEKIPSLFYMDNYSGLNFTPTHFVNITESIEVKKQMLLAHQSQVQWMMEHSKLDVVDQMITTAKYRGYQAGVPYAEAFAQEPSFPLVKTGTLLPCN
jgi:LmbE family N-acetylglucosaminyl deacetylase